MHHKGLLKKVSTLGEEISSQLQLLASFTDVSLSLIVRQLGIDPGTFQQDFSPLLEIGSLVAELITFLADDFCFLLGDGVCHRCIWITHPASALPTLLSNNYFKRLFPHLVILQASLSFCLCFSQASLASLHPGLPTGCPFFGLWLGFWGFFMAGLALGLGLGGIGVWKPSQPGHPWQALKPHPPVAFPPQGFHHHSCEVSDLAFRQLHIPDMDGLVD